MNAKQNAEVRSPVIAGSRARPNATARPSEKTLEPLSSAKRAICNAAWDLWKPGHPSPPLSMIGKYSGYAQSRVEEAEAVLRERDLWPGAAVELAIVSEVEPKAKLGPPPKPDDGEWVGGAQALKILGLSDTSWMTLYRHVERGHIAARPAEEGRKRRLYRRADVEAVAASPPPTNPGGRPRKESAAEPRLPGRKPTKPKGFTRRHKPFVEAGLLPPPKPPTHASAGGVPADALSAGSPPPPAGVPITVMPPASPIELETAAMAIVHQALDPLAEPARRRVVAWARQFFALEAS